MVIAIGLTDKNLKYEIIVTIYIYIINNSYIIVNIVIVLVIIIITIIIIIIVDVHLDHSVYIDECKILFITLKVLNIYHTFVFVFSEKKTK